MLKHLEQDHGVKPEQERLEFENMDAFLDWKENEQGDNHVYFVKQRGLRFHKGWYDQHYYCQRDGSARAHVKKGQPERKTNRRAKKGVTKTGIACPAKMSVKYQKGERKVSVIYTKTHSHPINILDTQFHPIPKRTIVQLSEQFARGVPVKQMHKEIKTFVNEYLHVEDKLKSAQAQQQQLEEASAEQAREAGEGGEKEVGENVKENEVGSTSDGATMAEVPMFSPLMTIPPRGIRVLNKRQLHAIKVQADTMRMRDACQKLVNVFERSARVRKKLLDHATRTVEDLLEECIGVALAPTASSVKRTRKEHHNKKAKKRKTHAKDVIKEAAIQENINTSITTTSATAVHEIIIGGDGGPGNVMVEDAEEMVEAQVEESAHRDVAHVEDETMEDDVPPPKDCEDEIPHDQQTVEIPLTSLGDTSGGAGSSGNSRQIQLQDALPEEESCVVTLLAQMEGQTVIDYYRDKEPVAAIQTVETEVCTYSDSGGGGGEMSVMVGDGGEGEAGDGGGTEDGHHQTYPDLMEHSDTTATQNQQ